MKLRGSHLVALAILAGIGGWMLTGDLIVGGQVDPDAKSIAEREAERSEEAFAVKVRTIQPTERVSSLTVRGRTKADAMVSVRAETGGTVEKRLVEKGEKVSEGDLLCTIDQGIRASQLTQARAQLEQAKADYEANQKLVERGFATKSRLRQLKSAYDAAIAAVAAAEQEMTRTEVRATTSGTVYEPIAEVGDNLSPGGVCVTLVDRDPMLFTGQVSEREIGALQEGMTAEVGLVSGETVSGTIRSISPTADAQTRTFAVEIALPNADQRIRAGMTAKAEIRLQPTSAYKVESNWLTLADNGEIGVRAVGDDNVVHFHQVTILSQGNDHFWVGGLEPGMRVITLGQNFVAEGQIVTTEDDRSARLEPTAEPTGVSVQ